MSQSTTLAEAYKAVEDHTKTWSGLVKQEAKATQDCFEFFSKYATMTAGSLREIGSTKDLYEKVYSRMSESLRAKKERLFKAKDVQKWELEAIMVN